MPNRRCRVSLIVACCLGALLLASAGLLVYGLMAGRVSLGTEQVWSIGIYSGTGLSRLSPAEGVRNPVLTAADVSDVPASFVADPFMVVEGGTWYMFFEVMNKSTQQGDIGLATSDDGLLWHYRQIVLDEAFHLSYPHVFSWQRAYYMIPESFEADSVRLYRAEEFPVRWSLERILLRGSYVDSSIVQHGGRWWLFTCPEPRRSSKLEVYHADSPAGPWVRHPKSPVVRDQARFARAAGRFLAVGDNVLRLTQDDDPTYGRRVYGFEITALTPDEYVERPFGEGPLLKEGAGRWNMHGMHQLDAHWTGQRWVAAVDGYFKKATIGVIY